MKITIAKDFSPVPSGRYRDDGPASGEGFREDYLIPAIEKARSKGERLEVVFDGLEGVSASFLEEAFGGLVRNCGFTSKELHRELEVFAADPMYRPFIQVLWDDVDSAKPENP